MPSTVDLVQGEYYSLDALARLLEPEAYQAWEKERRARERDELASGFGLLNRMQMQAKVADLVYGQYETSKLWLEDREFEALVKQLRGAVRNVISSAEYLTQAVREDATPVEIPHHILRELGIDLVKNTLSTRDGGCRSGSGWKMKAA
jgi:hypothetical protein